jgi:hypothetical protein
MPAAASDRSATRGNMIPVNDSLREVVLDIAEVALKFKYRNQPDLCRVFRKFTAGKNNSAKNAWSLNSADINNKGLKNKLLRSANSSFFDDPVMISLKNRHITRFHSKDTSKHPAISDRFITYACSQALAASRGALLHAAAVIKDKEAYLFLGPSGSGKSTAASLSAKYKVIGDDVVAVKKSGTYYRAYPTPWKQAPFVKGAERLNAKVRAVFFIRKSARVSFKPVPPEEALKRILYSHIHFLCYTRRGLLDGIFATACGFVRNIPVYDMEFTKKDDFWPKLEDLLNAQR